MNKITKLSVMGAMIATTGCLGFSGLASAASLTQSSQTTQVYRANLEPLNNSGASGTATVKVMGNMLRVTIHSTGLSPNLPHAEHIHIGGQNVCPTVADDANHDGIVDIAEGMPKYGDVKVSLVTSGDDSAASALALTRYPVADANGTINYHETLALPSGVSASNIANGVVVQHGISQLFNDPTKYDGSRQSADPDAPAGTPLEATVPADCGKLLPVNNGNSGGNGNGQGTNGSGSSISNTGPGSTNTVTSSTSDNTSVTNNNDVSVSSSNSQSSNSGNANSSSNTYGGYVSSGSASNSNNTNEMVTVENN